MNALHAALVAYPEYPPQIERDHAYAVRVVQGTETRVLPVYNHCEKSALSERTWGGDVNRRFCEFAFSGDPVRVDIALCEDVRCYSVFPASRHLRHAFRDGVISVWIDKPTNFGIRLNDLDKSILSVFADAPEDPAGVPRHGDPGVLFVDRWTDPPGPDGTIVVEPPVREVYIAPGAVLNARLVVKTENARVHGRGMILDPFSDIFRFNQTNNTRRLVVTVSGKGSVVEDVKIVDARTFNYGSWAENVTFRNVRALSSMMCSDGITSGGSGLLVDGAWLYVGDNALVVSGLRDSVYRNVAIGTSCNAIFPQHGNEGITMEGIDVFRADEGLLKNSYNGALRRKVKWKELDVTEAEWERGPQDLEPRRQSFRFRDLSAVDCVLFPRFFVGGNMGTLPKTFAFENLSIPHSTGADEWRSIGKTNGVAVSFLDDPDRWLVSDNFALSITNFWLGGERAEGFAPEVVKNGRLGTIDVVNLTAEPSPRPARAVVDWTCPWKAYVGGALQRDWRLVDRAAGERRLPAPPPGENLLADRASTRSAWQRCPSWMAKLEANATDESGARVYRLIQSENGAGMLNVFTEAFLRNGPGTYRLSFEAAAKASDETVALTAVVLSNEKRIPATFRFPSDGTWRSFEADLALDFDPAATGLVALHLKGNAPIDELAVKNLSLAKQP